MGRAAQRTKGGCVAKHPADLIRSFRVGVANGNVRCYSWVNVRLAMRWHCRIYEPALLRRFRFLLLWRRRVPERGNWNVTRYQKSFRLNERTTVRAEEVIVVRTESLPLNLGRNSCAVPSGTLFGSPNSNAKGRHDVMWARYPDTVNFLKHIRLDCAFDGL